MNEAGGVVYHCEVAVADGGVAFVYQNAALDSVVRVSISSAGAVSAWAADGGKAFSLGALSEKTAISARKALEARGFDWVIWLRPLWRGEKSAPPLSRRLVAIKRVPVVWFGD